MKDSPAFTFVEMLIVIALIGIVSLVGFSNYSRSKNNQQLKAAAEILADNLRRVHVYSREMRDERVWGIASNSVNAYDIISAVPKSTVQAGVTTPIPPDTYQTQETVTIDPPVVFNPPFGQIWFIQGSGAAYQQWDINLDNSHNLIARVTVLPTGTIEVHQL